MSLDMAYMLGAVAGLGLGACLVIMAHVLDNLWGGDGTQ